MHLALKTLLNRVEPMKGFVYESSRIHPAGKTRRGDLSATPSIEIGLRAHHSQSGHCSQCLRPAPGYDTLPERRFQFVPLWGMPTWFLYTPRRLECDQCGIHVEHPPWALGKRPVTQSWSSLEFSQFTYSLNDWIFLPNNLATPPPCISCLFVFH